MKVTSSTWIQAEQLAYNMEVDEFHTYFVGESGAWVHNKCGGHGNSKQSTKSQHIYEIKDKESGEVVKTGVSGGRIRKDGKSSRAESQVRSKKFGADKYESTIIGEVPAGPGARQKILDMEKSNASGLRESGQLSNPDLHSRP